MSAGLYHIRAKSGGSEIALTKIESTAGGSHEALWALLNEYMRTAVERALLDPTDPPASAMFAATIEKFNTVVKKRGGEKWFTQVRNKVNYSHSFGAWFPHTGSTTDTSRVENCLSGWLKDPSEVPIDLKADEITQFAQACSFLVSLCRVTIQDVAYRSIAQSPFRQASARLAAGR
jgi:hypothetical protein